MSEVKEIVTPVGYLAFDQFLGTKDENGKFRAGILFDKDTKGLDKLKKYLKEAAEASGLNPKKDKMPLKEYTGDAEYGQDRLVLNYSTQFPFAFVDEEGDEVTANSFKAGDKVKLAIKAYSWSFQGKKGISCNIVGILMVEPCSEDEQFFQKRSGASIFGFSDEVESEDGDDGELF